jgi:hypothetical protein
VPVCFLVFLGVGFSSIFKLKQSSSLSLSSWKSYIDLELFANPKWSSGMSELVGRMSLDLKKA